MPLLIYSLICIKGQLYRARFGLVGTNKENQIVIFLIITLQQYQEINRPKFQVPH